MSVLAFYPLHNTPGKRDSTGAFLPGARAFVAKHGGALCGIDCRAPKPARRARVLAAIAEDTRTASPRHAIAFFGHGLARSIQFGFGLEHVDDLAAAIAAATSPMPALVPLYACDAAGGPGPGGDGGFADALRDALCRRAEAGARDCIVDAHVTTGHSFFNPHIRRFWGDGSPTGGQGGEWIVRPGHSLWPAWRRALRESDLWAEFPFLSTAEIHTRLAPARAA